jgi:hypothetical protein
MEGGILMKLRINSSLYDLSTKTTSEQSKLYRKWYAAGEKKIECLCVRGRVRHPIMHIRKTESKDKQVKYSLVNNRKSDNFHHHSCPNNSKQKEYLKDKGISYQEGILKMNYSNGEDRSHQWTSFFLGLLQLDECSIATYKYGQTRNISSRVYKAASLCEVDGSRLLGENKFDIQVIKKGKRKVVIRNTHESPRLIIGWGSGEVDYKEHQQYDFLGKLPLYSVDDPKEFVCNISLKKSLLEETKDNIKRSDSQGWWLVWRDRNKKGILEVKDLVFIPADPITRMPVNSLYEEMIIGELIKLRRDFSKPLLWKMKANGIELKPNFIINEGNKDIVLEIAGNLDEFYNLNKLEKIYKNMGYKFIEWRAYDEEHTLSQLQLKNSEEINS